MKTFNITEGEQSRMNPIGYSRLLKLNKTKCETLIMNGTANVHFPDGTPVKQLPEVKYLGCYLNEHADLTKEVKSKIAACMATLKKLDVSGYTVHAQIVSKY